MSSHILQVQELTKSVPDKLLFDQINFLLRPGDKVGLVADNGAGKSTLLKIIAGEVEPDSGDVDIDKTATVGYLSQKDKFPKNKTVEEVLLSFESETGKLLQDYYEALRNGVDKRLPELVEKIQAVDGWEYEQRIESVTNEMHLTYLLDRTIKDCSGGERKRVALAKLLIDQPDFLILDEPTNHLDLSTIDRLENFLKKSHRTVFLVTHDRYFLENICVKILELDRGSLYEYPGNYSKYLEQKAKRLEVEEKQHHKMKQEFKKELQWINRQAQGRGTKSNKRQEEFSGLKKDYRQAGKSLQDKSDQMEISLQERRMGGNIVSIHNLYKSFGEKKIVEDFSYNFSAGERVGIVGPNGVGKSTFIKMLAGKEDPDSGNIKVGKTIEVSLYRQEHIDFEPHKKVIDLVKDVAEYITIKNGKQLSASALLQKFLFSPDKQQQRARTLSGGERRRIALLRAFIANPNFLILDEPTNDFDIATLRILEDFLSSFKGCLVVISHDRFFLDKVVDKLFVFEGRGKIKQFPGNYSMWRDTLTNDSSDERNSDKNTKGDSTKAKVGVKSNTKTRKMLEKQAQRKKSLSNKERKEYKELGERIEQLEEKREQVNLRLSTETLTHEEIKELSEELANIGKQIEESEERRLELAERK